MLAMNALKVIYVSCEPTSLARDLDRLHAHGYRVASVHPFDMFPQTEQVETVVLLERV
jgi:tRNA/tmRNA/rRNA uracil-C5-methylase (TrmA/RlmC/RlmD family)